MSQATADCVHVFDDPRRHACTRCGVSVSEIRAGRDKPATWGDVDLAYERGVAAGLALRRFKARGLRRRAFVHGARFVIEKLDGRWALDPLELGDNRTEEQCASSELDSFGLPFGRYQPLGDKVVDAEGNELRIESVRPALESDDNRTEEQ